MKWIEWPDTRLDVCGLPWLAENAPDLWRLPERARDMVREPVWELARAPDGARIRFAADTSQLSIRVETSRIVTTRDTMSVLGQRGLDVYVDGVYWSSVPANEPGESELAFFNQAGGERKHVTIYLPIFQEIRVRAIGVDPGARLTAAPPFALERPIVFYGSSICQGACASRPGMTYPAIVARRLNLDYVNLGFGGNGRAEPEVVRLINEIDACCFVLDLGKSYGMQPADVYAAMLDTLRSSHPSVPLVCITPIFSTREIFSADYAALSTHTRNVMRQAAAQRIEAGDTLTHLVEGLDLCGQDDADAFQEGVHPTDLGFARIADRLLPTIRDVLSGTGADL